MDPSPDTDLARETARRRTFAIISHPDAGKTTLTEKLLLYSGAIDRAGSVKAREGGAAMAAQVASGYALPFAIAWWVTVDARKRGRELCYDFDSFVYFAWPVAVPVYLFQTRGAWAFLTLLCFAGIWVTAMIPAMVVFLLREFRL